MSNLSRSARKVQQALDRFGLSFDVVELPASTRTAADAAAAIGTATPQIAKSLVFRAVESGDPVLVIASGGNRVNENTVGDHLGQPIRKADADFVRQATGFAIGGVPPVGHSREPKVFIDADLLAFDRIWAAAGTPNAVFSLTPQELLRITGGNVIPIQ